MKLSTKGRYAVMAMVDLASHGRAHPVSLNDISIRQGLPINYLEQIFVKLRRKGLVESTRGKQGGYKLATPPSEISVLHIMQAVGEPLQTTRCDPVKRAGCQGGSTRCITHNLWDDLGAHITAYLASKSLAEFAPEE